MFQKSVSFRTSFFADSVAFLCFGQLEKTKRRVPLPQADPVWELVYVDQGELAVAFGVFRFMLSSGSFFIRPLDSSNNSFSVNITSLRLITFSFSCSSPFLYLLSDRILHSTKPERMLFAQLLLRLTVCRDSCPNSFMEHILDRLLVRRFLSDLLAVPAALPAFPPLPIRRSDLQYLALLQYLKTHLFMQLSIDKICRDNLIGRSRLEQLFREKGWHGVIACFSHMKIDTAKCLIAEGNMTFTQIAMALGYSSVHYFSRQFKEKTKMTPTGYSSFLKEHPGDVIPSLSRYYTLRTQNIMS